MGCNCGGSFDIAEGAEEVQSVVGDPSYFWSGQPGVTSENAEGSLVAPNGTPVWSPDGGTRTEQDGA